MDLDKKMLDEMQDTSSPILHLYEWLLPSITYGYFIDPEKYLNMESIKKLNIDIGKRPTGGGIVFHLWDMAFSFLLPAVHKNFSLNTIDNYFFVNSCVLSAVNEFMNVPDQSPKCIFSDLDRINGIFPQNDATLFEEDKSVQDNLFKEISTEHSMGVFIQNFCMARPTKFDVIVKGKKVAGAAQRRTKKGYLNQGTIALTMPDKSLLSDVLLDKKTIFFMNMNTFPLFQGSSTASVNKKNELKSFLIAQFEKNLF